jgi:hypothetical protein
LRIKKAESGLNPHRRNHSLHSSQHRPVPSAEQWGPAERTGRLAVFPHELQAVFAAFVLARQNCKDSGVPADYAFARLTSHAQVPHESRVAGQVEKRERSGEEVPDCVAESETKRPELARLVLVEQNYAG